MEQLFYMVPLLPWLHELLPKWRFHFQVSDVNDLGKALL